MTFFFFVMGVIGNKQFLFWGGGIHTEKGDQLNLFIIYWIYRIRTFAKGHIVSKLLRDTLFYFLKKEFYLSIF